MERTQNTASEQAGACLSFRTEFKGAATEKVGPKALRQPGARLGTDRFQRLDRAHVHASVGGAQHGQVVGGRSRI
jgi:hypothetical protein